MRRLKTIASAMAVALVLVASLDYVASAATGGKFILGQLNKANKTTTLKRTTGGPALQLATTSSTASPLVVNGRGRVANLNADLLDGKDSAALLATASVFTSAITTPTSELDIVIPLPAGRYLISYSAYLATSTGSLASCVIMRRSVAAPSTNTYVGRSQFDPEPGSYPGLTGSGYVEKSGDATIHLGCSSATFTTTASEPIQIVAVKLPASTGPVALTPLP
jgi:hypothetical protein